MHDVDGLVGLWVYDRPGGVEANRVTWRLYGNGTFEARTLTTNKNPF